MKVLTQRIRIVLAGALALIVPNSVVADWPTKANLNLAICTAPGHQVSPLIVADGSGGAIIVWGDQRAGNWDVYAQHVLASGEVDPRWPVDGQAVCVAENDQTRPKIVGDGTGGAIIVWEDHRGADGDIYAQHVLAGGEVDPQWPSNGQAVRAATHDQLFPEIINDGVGGVILVWLDGLHHDAIHAQRLLMDGQRDTTWPSESRVVCSVAGASLLEENPGASAPLPLVPDIETRIRLIPDGTGGAVVVWDDQRGGNWDIVAQHVLASGAVDPNWPAVGRAFGSDSAAKRRRPAVVADGAGGAIVAWDGNDDRSGHGGIYVQHLRNGGAPDSTWPALGRLVSPSTGSMSTAVLLADGAGGSFVTWNGDRHALQHVLARGILDPAWPVDGCFLSGYHGDWQFQVVPDGAGGVIVVWAQDLDGVHLRLRGSYKTHEGNIVAQRVLANGTVDPLWPKRGSDVSAAKRRQWHPSAIADGAGGAIVVWEDWRTETLKGPIYCGDIYAQRVRADGTLGGSVVVKP